MRGRKPELTAIDGGLSRGRAAPSWLPEDAKAVWRHIMPELLKRRTTTSLDLTTVEHFCLAAGMVRNATRTLAEEGEMLEGKRHPAHVTLFQALTESRRLAAELGLTPASRAKAETLAAEESDELAGMVS